MYSLWFIRLSNVFVFSNTEPPIINGLYGWSVIWSLLNCVSHVLTCSRTNVPCMLTCSRANVPYVLTYSRANVPKCLACSRAHVPTCFACLLALRTMSTNDKVKFSITCCPYILWLFFVFFPWNKTFVHFCVSLTSQKPLTGAMTNFVKWNALVFVWA